MRDLREYLRPASAAEAVEIKQQHGDRAVYLAGGTDLLVLRPREVEVAIDIRHAGMDYVRQENGAIVIGGAALLRDVEMLGQVAGGMLRTAARETAPWLIRNAATLAGNIANASPAADSVPALLALDVELRLLDEGSTTTSSIEDVLLGPHRTTLADRLIQEIVIPAGAVLRRGFFIKHARSKSDIAQVNAAVTARVEGGVVRDIRIALGAVAPTAIRARTAEREVEGQEITPDLLLQLERTVREEVRPISDWRASEDYRRRISGVLVRRALERIMGETEERRGAAG